MFSIARHIFQAVSINIFLILYENMRGTSNEYPQPAFSWRNKELTDTSLIWSYDFLREIQKKYLSVYFVSTAILILSLKISVNTNIMNMFFKLEIHFYTDQKK